MGKLSDLLESNIVISDAQDHLDDIRLYARARGEALLATAYPLPYHVEDILCAACGEPFAGRGDLAVEAVVAFTPQGEQLYHKHCRPSAPFWWWSINPAPDEVSAPDGQLSLWGDG